jgi:two-component system response regulator (stage 0 sporulation protein F)
VSLSGTRILIVEDDEAVRQVLERFFHNKGCVVRSASTGAAALKLVEQELPDLLLLDLMLPWVNGIEVLTALRQQPSSVNLAVLVTTGTATTSFDLRSFGPLRVMRKPFDLTSLAPVIRELLGHGESGEDDHRR